MRKITQQDLEEWKKILEEIYQDVDKPFKHIEDYKNHLTELSYKICRIIVDINNSYVEEKYQYGDDYPNCLANNEKWFLDLYLLMSEGMRSINCGSNNISAACMFLRNFLIDSGVDLEELINSHTKNNSLVDKE